MRGLLPKATEKLLLKSNREERGAMAAGLSGETAAAGPGLRYLAVVLIKIYFSHLLLLVLYLN